jgi:hypothetical protein
VFSLLSAGSRTGCRKSTWGLVTPMGARWPQAVSSARTAFDCSAYSRMALSRVTRSALRWCAVATIRRSAGSPCVHAGRSTASTAIAGSSAAIAVRVADSAARTFHARQRRRARCACRVRSDQRVACHSASVDKSSVSGARYRTEPPPPRRKSNAARRSPPERGARRRGPAW